MKLAVPGLLLLATAAFAGSEERIDSSLAKGEKALAKAGEVEGAKVLRALEAAKPHFRRARTLAANGLEGAPGAAEYGVPDGFRDRPPPDHRPVVDPR